MRFHLHLLATLGLGLAACAASAQTSFPNRPIKLVVGYAAGGAADTIARVVADAMARDLGQAIVVENKPGAGATLAATFVAQSPPDGYTLFIGNDYLYGADQYIYKVRYDGARDFTHIAKWVSSPFVAMVNKDSGIRNVADLVARAKDKPQAVAYSSAGLGTGPHLAGIHFGDATGTSLLHVPYKGGAPAVQAVLAGEVLLTFSAPAATLPHIKAGRAIALGVTSERRSPGMPDIPSLAEQGLAHFDLSFWAGLVGPAGLPLPVVERLAQASAKALADPAVREKLQTLGNEVAAPASPKEFEAFALRTGRLTAELVQKSGAKVD